MPTDTNYEQFIVTLRAEIASLSWMRWFKLAFPVNKLFLLMLERKSPIPLLSLNPVI